MNDVGFFVRCDKIKFPQKKPLRWRSKFNRNIACKIWPGYIMQREVWLPNEDDPNREKYVEVWYSGNRRRIETYIMKTVQGPKREDNYENHLANLLECCGDLVFPDDYKDKIIKEIHAPHGKL